MISCWDVRRGTILNIEFYEQLKHIISEEFIEIDEMLSNHTTFQIGGKADYFVKPSKGEQIVQIINLCKEYDIPFYVMGNGSNILVSDQGYKGLIIQILKNMSYIHFEESDHDNEGIVSAGAGVMLSDLAKEIANKSLTGFEFASGIPGTLGGAVTMNAGAYGGEIKNCIVNATVIDSFGNIRILSREELAYGYRRSVIQTKNYIVIEAMFQLKKGNKNDILAYMEDLNNRRKEKQPLEYPSAGSTFKRPEGYFAGKLIMDSGLRGYRVGDIMVSEKHCGFVINVGNGTAKDVKQLISDVDSKVYEKFSVHLEPEIRFLGDF